MSRGRWVRPMALLLLVVGGGGYWLARRDPGQVLRTIPVGRIALGSALDQATGRLFITNWADSSLTLIDTRSGDVLRTIHLAGATNAFPLVDQRTDRLIVAASGADYLLDPHTGAIARATFDPSNHEGIPAIDHTTGILYFSHTNVSGLDISDGRTGVLMRTFTSCTGTGALALSPSTRHIFEPCTNGTTEMRDLRTGQLLRTINTTGIVVCDCWPIVDEPTGRLFLPGAGGLAVVDARMGALLRMYTAILGLAVGFGSASTGFGYGATALDPRTGNLVALPFIGNGSPTGHVVLFDGHTGAVLHRWPVPANPTGVLVNSLTGHLLVTSAGPTDSSGEPAGDGALSVLDMHSGVVLHRIELGINPGDSQIDRRTGRLVVVNCNCGLDHTALTKGGTEGWWPQTLRHIKGVMAWLPFAAPAPPSPFTHATVSMLDLRKL